MLMARRLRRCLSSSAVATTAGYPRLEAVPRADSELGTRKSQHMRVYGRIPGVLYGVGEDGARERRLVSVATRDLQKEMRTKGVTIENTLYELDVEGAKTVVLPRQIQVRVPRGQVVSCNFLRFHRGTLVSIPLRYVDADDNPYLRRGGYLHRVLPMVKCYCDTFDIPSHLTVSIAKGGKDTVFRLDDIQMVDGLRIKPPRGPGVLAVIQGRTLDTSNA